MRTRLTHALGDVHLVGSVHGLVSEGERVLRLLDEIRPAVLALGVSQEGAESLAKFEGEEDPALFEDLPTHEAVYSVSLERFGAVRLPPPDLLGAVRAARDQGVQLRGVDLTEEAYVDAFTKRVNTFGFLKLGRIQKRLSKKPPKATDPYAFALEWDRRMRAMKGLAKVEALREETIARNTRNLLDEGAGPIFLLVDYARYEGVRARLLDEHFDDA